MPSGLVPLSADHAILRVPTEIERAKWIAAITLAISNPGSLTPKSPSEEKILESKEEEEEEEKGEEDEIQVNEINSVNPKKLPRQLRRRHRETTYVPWDGEITSSEGTVEEVLEQVELLLSFIFRIQKHLSWAC